MTQTGILISFRPAETDGASPALVNQVARQVIDGLRSQQQEIKPAYIALRSGEVYQWLVTASTVAQSLLPLASFSLVVVQLLNELKKLTAQSDSARPQVIVIYDTSKTPVPIESDQALLERLLREHLPEQIDPAQASIEVQVAEPAKDDW
ncbi:hypothetical protein [Chloroflexus sp.]|uniref:hypothetical protein n=1 Tax=Chloroflexus sp. TaxID=1904827 RepID=UPI002607AC3D|nr:hypothetical protein [uncultured Chloroflexus sp.]